MVNSKKKGSKNERKIAQLFSQWTGYEFTRTPGSGGLRWQNRGDVIGDLVCTDDTHARRFPFSIECKVRNKVDFSHLILTVNSDIIQFWEQSKQDAKRGSKLPLVVFRYDHMASGLYFVLIDQRLLQFIDKEFLSKSRILILNSPDNNFAILRSDEFFTMDYSIIYKTARKILKDAN